MKRMFMDLYGNTKIAIKSRNKCFRTAYQFALNHCTVIDKSYY